MVLKKCSERKTTLVIVGDPKECAGCRDEKEFIEKNKKELKCAGIKDVKFINPDSDAGIKFRNKYIKGLKAEPLNILQSGKTEVPFLGFNKGGFVKLIKKSIKKMK